MSLRAYSEINLHIVWHVKDNNPVLTDEVESQLHRFLRGRAFQTSGVFFHEVGGTENHVHLAVSVPPTLLISEWIGQLKGASSHFINHEIVNRKILEWQVGYGVVTFGTTNLPWVKEYIRNQRQHHMAEQIFERLERSESDDKQTGQGPSSSGKPDESG